MRGSREISLVPSLHRASTDALIRTVYMYSDKEREKRACAGEIKLATVVRVQCSSL